MSVITRRMTAKIEGEFVVFLIGARINKWWKLPRMKWLGDAFGAMVAELQARPELGYLGGEQWGGRTSIMVQYWRSQEQLMAYARTRDTVHFPAWVRFNKEVGSNGDFGIWHETYLIRPGDYECVYSNMPLFGLAKATQSVPAEGTLLTAQGRLGITQGDDAPIAVDGSETHR